MAMPLTAPSGDEWALSIDDSDRAHRRFHLQRPINRVDSVPVNQDTVAGGNGFMVRHVGW
jgi:hypothetical protein